MSSGKYEKGELEENLVREKLSWKIGRKVIRHINYDEYGSQSWQCVVVNGQKFICPDLEVYENEDLKMRVEVKSFQEFPNNLPFEAKGKVLVISKGQFAKYLKLQMSEEIPIFIVFAVFNGFDDYDFYWASIEDMNNRFPRREGLYTWKQDRKTEVCYFFRENDFYTNIQDL